MVSTAVSVVEITVWLSFTVPTDWMLQQTYPSNTLLNSKLPSMPSGTCRRCRYQLLAYQAISISVYFFSMWMKFWPFSSVCVSCCLFFLVSVFIFGSLDRRSVRHSLVFHPDWDPKIKTSFCYIYLNKTEILPVVLLLAVIKQWGHLHKANKH